MSTRINARLDPALAAQLETAQRMTGKTTTEIVVEALQRYLREELGGARPAAELFAESGFIGCAEGPADLSSRYKEELTKSWSRKSS